MGKSVLEKGSRERKKLSPGNTGILCLLLRLSVKQQQHAFTMQLRLNFLRSFLFIVGLRGIWG